MELKELDEIINGNECVVVKLGAEWCQPCKSIEPILIDFEKELEFKFVDVDVEDSPDISARYRVRNIPTILYFKDGELKDKTVGSVTKDSIREKIDAIL